MAPLKGELPKAEGLVSSFLKKTRRYKKDDYGMHHNRLQFASEINQITSKAVLRIIITIIIDIMQVICVSAFPV